MANVLSADSAVFTNSATQYTIPFNANFAGPSRKLVVGISYYDEIAGSAEVQSATFNGTPMSVESGVSVLGYGANIVYLDSPELTTGNIVINFSIAAAGLIAFSYLFDNIAAGSPADTVLDTRTSPFTLASFYAPPSISVAIATCDDDNTLTMTGTGVTVHPDGNLKGTPDKQAAISSFVQVDTNPQVSVDGMGSGRAYAFMAVWDDSVVLGNEASTQLGTVRAGDPNSSQLLNSAVVTNSDPVTVNSVSTLFDAHGFTRGRKLVVGLGVDKDSVASLNQGTFNGTALTKAVEADTSPSLNGEIASLWYLDNPDSVEGLLTFSGADVRSATLFVYLFDQLVEGVPLSTDAGIVTNESTPPDLSVTTDESGAAVSMIETSDPAVTFTLDYPYMDALPDASSGVSTDRASRMTAYTENTDPPGTLDHGYTLSSAPARTGQVIAYWPAGVLTETVIASGVETAGSSGSATVSAGGTFAAGGVQAAAAVGDVTAFELTGVALSPVVASTQLGAVSLQSSSRVPVTNVSSAALLGIAQAQIIGETTVGSLLTAGLLNDVATFVQTSAGVNGEESPGAAGIVATQVNNQPSAGTTLSTTALGAVTIATNSIVSLQGLEMQAEVDTTLVWGPVRAGNNPNWTEIVP